MALIKFDEINGRSRTEKTFRYESSSNFRKIDSMTLTKFYYK